MVHIEKIDEILELLPGLFRCHRAHIFGLSWFWKQLVQCDAREEGYKCQSNDNRCTRLRQTYQRRNP